MILTVSPPSDGDYFPAAVPLLADLASMGLLTGADGGSYVVRTWDPVTGDDVVRLLVTSEPGLGKAGPVLAKHGFVVGREQEDTGYGFPPLWNAGVSGPGFARVSAVLCSVATRFMGDVATRWGQDPPPSPPALDAALLMVAHSRATLERSPQLRLPGHDLSTLLPLRLISYRSHYEAVRARAVDPQGLDRACADVYASIGGRLRSAVAAARVPDGPATDDALRAGWAQAIGGIHGGLMRAFRAGDLTDAGKSLQDLEDELGTRLEPTRFHLPPREATREFMHGDPDFMAYRLETSLLYSVLYTLGYSLPARYVLCQAVARANEEVSGRDADELRDGFEELAAAVMGAGAGATRRGTGPGRAGP